MPPYNIVGNVNDNVLDVVTDADYKLCLGVVIEGDDKTYPSIALESFECQYTLDVYR